MKIHILNLYQVCVKSSILLTLILFSKGNNYLHHMNKIIYFYKDHEDVVKNDKYWHLINLSHSFYEQENVPASVSHNKINTS